MDLEVWFWFSKFGFVDRELRCGGYGGFGGGSPNNGWTPTTTYAGGVVFQGRPYTSRGPEQIR